MGINSNPLEIFIQNLNNYAKHSGVKSILQTTPRSLKGVNIDKLKPLPSDIVQLNTNISPRFFEVNREQIPQITQELLLGAKAGYNDFVLNLKDIFIDLPGRLIYGIKPEESINKKLLERITQLNTIYSSDSTDSTMKIARECVPDLIRARFILNKGNKREVDAVVKTLLKAIDKGDLKLIDTLNYGKNPYINWRRAQHRILLGKGGYGFGFKPSGYTGTHFYFLDKNNNLFELQLRGAEVDKIANNEHADYRKYRHGGIRTLNEKGTHEQTIKYLYKHARAKELKS